MQRMELFHRVRGAARWHGSPIIPGRGVDIVPCRGTLVGVVSFGRRFSFGPVTVVVATEEPGNDYIQKLPERERERCVHESEFTALRVVDYGSEASPRLTIIVPTPPKKHSVA